MWKFKKQYENARIVTPEKVIVDKITITDELVNNLLKLHSDHAEYFEREQNDVPAPAGLKLKRQRDEG